ncbi:VanZ family protein [Thermococcus sp.]
MKPMRRKFLEAYLLLLLYLNLTPAVPSSPVSGGDKAVHFLEFAVLAFLGRERVMIFLPFPVLLELLQISIPGRTFSVWDMVANLIGFAAGALMGWWHEGPHEGASLFNKGRD